MTTREFIKKIAIKVVIYSIISTIVLYAIGMPILTNELALGQMENSDESYVEMETYNRVKPIISIIYGLVTVLFAATTIDDTHKFIKFIKNKGEN